MLFRSAHSLTHSFIRSSNICILYIPLPRRNNGEMDFLLIPEELLSHKPSYGFKMFLNFGNCRHDFAKIFWSTGFGSSTVCSLQELVSILGCRIKSLADGLPICEEYRQIKIENVAAKIVFLESLMLLSSEVYYKND